MSGEEFRSRMAAINHDIDALQDKIDQIIGYKIKQHPSKDDGYRANYVYARNALEEGINALREYCEAKECAAPEPPSMDPKDAAIGKWPTMADRTLTVADFNLIATGLKHMPGVEPDMLEFFKKTTDEIEPLFFKAETTEIQHKIPQIITAMDEYKTIPINDARKLFINKRADWLTDLVKPPSQGARDKSSWRDR